MSWEDRLSEAAYRSPGGTRTVFNYRDVTRTVEKNTTGFSSPDADGTLVQDLGHQGRKYPLRIIFGGPDCDTAADAFELTLLERGMGVLEHPRYGHVNVVPFGEIKQTDRIVTAANQSIIEVTFWATVGTAYPSSTADAADAAAGAVDTYQEKASEEFKNALKLDTQVEKVTLKGQWDSMLGTVSDTMKEAAEATEDVYAQFTEIQDSINEGIDVLIAQPLTMAFQTVAMVTTAANSLAAVQTRLDGYANLAGSIISTVQGRISTSSTSDPQVITPTLDNRANNTLAGQLVYAQAAVAGQVLSVVSTINAGGFTTQPQAIDAADQLFELLDDVTNWSDDNFAGLGVTDEGGAYQALVAAVAYAAGALVSESFSLKRERRIVLTSARGLFDVVAQYYKDLDQLDFFIMTNNLSGSDILELPKGKEIVIYS